MARKSNTAAKINTTETPAITIERPVVCFSLTMGSIGSKRTVAKSKIAVKKDAGEADNEAGTIVEDRDVDKRLLHVGKEILDSPELKALVKRGGEIRREVYRLSVPAQILKGGIYLIPVDLIPELETRLVQWRKDWDSLLDAFVDSYPKRVKDAEQRLGSLFNPRDYPDAARIRRAFTFQTDYLEIAVPQVLGTVNPKLYAEQRAKAERTWAKAAEEIRLGLLASFAGFVKHLNTKLGKEPDGKLSIFRDSTVTNLTEFLDMFDKRDVTNDAELRALVAKARNIVKTNGLDVDIDALRTDEGFRNVVKTEFARLEKTTGELVETRSRLIAFEDEV